MPWIAKDYKGFKFGKWELIERDLNIKRPIHYICRCECGAVESKNLQNIKRGLSKQCTKCQSLFKSKYLLGQKFHHLKILANEKINNKARLKVECDCGNICYLKTQDITQSRYKSYGKCDLNRKIPIKYKKPLKLGSKFGMLEIVQEIDKENSIAKCECRNEIKVKIYHMKTTMPSCGCYWKNKKIENAQKYVGLKWGKLKVSKFMGMQGENKRAHYLLKCKCGITLVREIGHMFDLYSCGCYQKEAVLRGEKNHNSKTNAIEVKTIRELFKSGCYTRKELAEMMNLKYEHICSLIRAEKAWKHVE